MASFPASPARAAFRALNRLVRPIAKLGHLSPPAAGGGLALLETTGRSSGLPREVPLLATRLGDRVVVSTVRSDSQWVRNLEADPAAGVWINGRRQAAVAEVRRGPLSVVKLALGEPQSSSCALAG
jgi:hypothetical protein